MSIRFVRIDDRLIHGQVVTAWIKSYKAKKILIIDDMVAADAFLIDVLHMVKPSGIDLIIRGCDHLQDTICEFEAMDASVVVLVKHPLTAKLLFENGVVLQELNVGGMGANKHRHAVYKNVSASEEEITTLKEIETMGVKVYFQATPNDKQVALNAITS